MQYQQKDKELIKITQTNKNYFTFNFHGANKNYSLICKNCKIVIPKQLEKQVIDWHHSVLRHPKETRTELIISQHFIGKIYIKQYMKSVLNAKHVSF